MGGDGRWRPGKFTCFHCCACLLLCLCGLLVGSFVNYFMGWVGGVVGFAVAVAGAILAWRGIERWYQAGPWVPPCHTGRCQGTREVWAFGDYQLVRMGDDMVHRCRCGHDYVITDRGRRFMERRPDGTLKPYMVHRPFRG